MSEQPSDTGADPGATWQKVTDQIKQRVVMPALWRAMERGHPVLLEGDEFVVGFNVTDTMDAHLLQEARYRMAIEQALASLAGRKVALRVITGTTIEDWRQIQEIERETARLRQAQPEAPQAAGANTWETLADQLTRHYSATPNRQYPGIQARFLDYCVDELAKAYVSLMGDKEEPEDHDLRAYGRVLDRIADRTSVPASMIGYLVLQRRRQGQ
jgi:hypothetical protein